MEDDRDKAGLCPVATNPHIIRINKDIAKYVDEAEAAGNEGEIDKAQVSND